MKVDPGLPGGFGVILSAIRTVAREETEVRTPDEGEIDKP